MGGAGRGACVSPLAGSERVRRLLHGAMSGGNETCSHTMGSSALRHQSRETARQRRRARGGRSLRILASRQSDEAHPPRYREVPPAQAPAGQRLWACCARGEAPI